ncbi:MAG: hypothetical protein A3C93_03770 [Candidatus Lloydbacteria bacterium RIFCSPHIGHO2_02_FULL_54_17]|uniref:DoxX family protein n=1 Tax=Candidatus Lloydbacteria bacterium RIFCSPHIGHO2_02_FULL_54_17 TaxID=1798664 RepID=A0A1G2DH45_9BACT|nr:MAG: hypothetical protein A3C93_03770 [Candidatus Lloydbacteria bacterium RIFCSPHIGHO2_02_FULL_54_17]OGZ15123.1 MAG: hypothetical protein A3H76_00500 [Candidatus Lloydbacteria bacterium RIFCSPLOWO2_02_FULL_54_12]OGZ15229.1 MAG: hypothetical protein A2948_05450 [Candidatus Lloydbacteria bacterium RIFCSPLOWO2_01_FULL_54_18]
MLSLLPELLDWGWYVPLIFRLFLGIYLIGAGWAFTKKQEGPKDRNNVPAFIGGGVALILLGLFFIAGIFVQALGAIGLVLAITAFYFRRRDIHAAETPQFYLLIGIVSFSLVFLGPGPFSFDLPL